MEKKINIIHIPSQIEGGVYYYRSLTPMTALKHMFPDRYDVLMTNDTDTAFQNMKGADLLTVHGCMYNGDFQMRMWNLITEAKKIGVKTILDMDDYWNYGERHPMYNLCMKNAYPVKAAVNFNLFDCITTTTKRMADEISKYNKNVHVVENGISLDDPQFSMGKTHSERIRFGFTGGASHVNDLKQIVDENDCFMDYIDKEDLDRIQVVLCGFNMDGKRIKIDKNGNRTEEELKPDENWWVQVEKRITKDYSIVSEEYRNLLLRYDKSDEQYDASDEPYRRVWSKPIHEFEYGHIYSNIDVLMVPLEDNLFNNMRSELKFIEAGFTTTAVIASKVPPYIDFGIDGQDCVFVGDMTPKGWSEAVKRLLNDDRLRNDITLNLRKRVLKECDLDQITQKRDKLYRSMLNK